MAKMIIDMKAKTVTVGNVLIDMENQQVIMGTEDTEIEVPWDDRLPAEITTEDEAEEVEVEAPEAEEVEVEAPEVEETEDEHIPLKAKQRREFKENREELVGTTAIIEGEEWLVEKHVKGSHYVVKRNSIRRSNQGVRAFGVSVTKRRDASHNRKDDVWSWWVDRHPSSRTVKEREEYEPRQAGKVICSRCGMEDKNILTCESTKNEDGTWNRNHREIKNRYKKFSER